MAPGSEKLLSHGRAGEDSRRNSFALRDEAGRGLDPGYPPGEISLDPTSDRHAGLTFGD
jgi:hypothetical protein